jgi:hypothetical protein
MGLNVARLYENGQMDQQSIKGAGSPSDVQVGEVHITHTIN